MVHMVDHEPPEYPAGSLEWEEPDGFWFDWDDDEEAS